MPINVERMKPTVLLTDGSGAFDLRELEKDMVSPEQARAYLEKSVDADLDKFAAFFCGELGNDPLTKAERATVKTYLAWKFGLGPKQE